jgi:RimJ/RimL family protein N-acetyltransferase
MPQLESLRLLLREPQPGDAPALAEGLAEYDVAKFLATAPHPYNEDSAKAFLARVVELRAKGEAYEFAILRKEDGKLIGLCGLHLKGGRYEIGYWVAKPFWGKGYATEAARKVLAFAFHDLKATDVWAGWYHDNLASGQVLRKLGFQAVGVEKKHSLARGEDVLCNRTQLTREHFGRKKAA